MKHNLRMVKKKKKIQSAALFASISSRRLCAAAFLRHSIQVQKSVDFRVQKHLLGGRFHFAIIIRVKFVQRATAHGTDLSGPITQTSFKPHAKCLS